MARWGFNASKGASSVQTIVGLTAAASSPRRFKVTDLAFGSNASPADNAFVMIIQRCTTAATATALTPNSLDAADTLASTVVVNATVTADGALTASAFLYSESFNQRASFRWVSAPYCELIGPATASNGIVVGLSAATTTTFTCGGIYEEY